MKRSIDVQVVCQGNNMMKISTKKKKKIYLITLLLLPHCFIAYATIFYNP